MNAYGRLPPNRERELGLERRGHVLDAHVFYFQVPYGHVPYVLHFGSSSLCACVMFVCSIVVQIPWNAINSVVDQLQLDEYLGMQSICPQGTITFLMATTGHHLHPHSTQRMALHLDACLCMRSDFFTELMSSPMQSIWYQHGSGTR